VHPPVEISEHELTSTATARGLLAKQTKAAVMQLEVVEEEEGLKFVLDMYRAEALSAILELDREGRIFKAGTTPINQAGRYPICQKCTLPVRQVLLRHSG
jgi:hypothetical protein